MKIKIKTEGMYFVTGALIVLLLASFYMINSKNSEIQELNSNINTLQNEVETYLAVYQSDSEDAQSILYQLCLKDVQCKEDYSRNLRNTYIEQIGILNFTFENRDAYFITEDLPKFEGNLNDFIYSSCPGFKITTLGRTYSIYNYKYSEGNIGILMNDEFVTLRCAWRHNPQDDSYTLIE